MQQAAAYATSAHSGADVQIVEKGALGRVFVPEQAGKPQDVGLVSGQEDVLILWRRAQARLPELVTISEYIAGKIALAERPSIYRVPACGMKLGNGLAIIKCRFLDLHGPVFPGAGSA
jgi:hypothetical protein